MERVTLRVAAASLIGVTACAAPVPEAEALEVADPEALVGGYAIVPDSHPRVAEAPPDRQPDRNIGALPPTPAPRLLVIEADDARCSLDVSCVLPNLCPFAVLGQGLPALRSDETALAHMIHAPIPYNDIELATDVLDGTRRSTESIPYDIELATDVLDGTRRSTESIFDENSLADVAEGELAGACDDARALVEGRVRTINAELARHDWRPMARLPVEVIPGPDTAADGFEGPDERTVPERPVQVRLRHGQYVVRVPGVRVLHRIAWAHGPNIDLGPVWADELSGIALLGYMNTNEVCSAAPPESVDARAAHLPHEVFAESRMRAAHAHTW